MKMHIHISLNLFGGDVWSLCVWFVCVCLCLCVSFIRYACLSRQECFSFYHFLVLAREGEYKVKNHSGKMQQLQEELDFLSVAGNPFSLQQTLQQLCNLQQFIFSMLANHAYFAYMQHSLQHNSFEYSLLVTLGEFCLVWGY